MAVLSVDAPGQETKKIKPIFYEKINQQWPHVATLGHFYHLNLKSGYKGRFYLEKILDDE